MYIFIPLTAARQLRTVKELTPAWRSQHTGAGKGIDLGYRLGCGLDPRYRIRNDGQPFLKNCVMGICLPAGITFPAR